MIEKPAARRACPRIRTCCCWSRWLSRRGFNLFWFACYDLDLSLSSSLTVSWPDRSIIVANLWTLLSAVRTVRTRQTSSAVPFLGQKSKGRPEVQSDDPKASDNQQLTKTTGFAEDFGRFAGRWRRSSNARWAPGIRSIANLRFSLPLLRSSSIRRLFRKQARVLNSPTLPQEEREKKILVVVSTVTDDVRLFNVPKMTVCALRFTRTARARILKAGGRCLTLDQLALLAPTGRNTLFLRGPTKCREAYRHFGPPPGAKGSKTKAHIISTARKSKRESGKRPKK